MKLDDFLKCKKVRLLTDGYTNLNKGSEYNLVRLEVVISNNAGIEGRYPLDSFEPVTDLLKSAENPLQNIELTPEFETEASEPKFKVGDKVYLFGADYIEEITKIIGANFYLAGADFDASVSIKEICHATTENYERLQATFPHIKFEQPPTQADIDNEAVDKLAKAMKDKLAKKREQGYHGWATCKHGDLVQLLINHVDKGDPIDVANFCAFLFARGEPLTESVLDE